MTYVRKIVGDSYEVIHQGKWSLCREYEGKVLSCQKSCPTETGTTSYVTTTYEKSRLLSGNELYIAS